MTIVRNKIIFLVSQCECFSANQDAIAFDYFIVGSWGKDASEAVHNAVVLEEVAKMACRTELINPRVTPAPDSIKEKHFMRKHGANAYYGQ